MPDGAATPRRSTASSRSSPSTGACWRSRPIPTVPLLERLRFLCIVGSNLDEFFEIRVAGIKEQLRAKVPPAGLTLQEARALLAQIGDEARALIDDQYTLLNDEVLPALERAGVQPRPPHRVHRRQRAWVAQYFDREMRPLLTPIGLDPAHPFPQVVNKSLNFVDRAFGHGRVRPRDGDRDRQGAAGAAARHPASAPMSAATTTRS